MNTSFNFEPEHKEKMLKDIKIFFWEQRDEEIGDLAAMLVLDFIMEQFGPYFYNKGIQDANTFMIDKIEDLFSLEK